MQRCHGCMKEYGKEFDVCPHCGYIAGTLPQNKSHLRGGTELCGRYMVGKVLGYGGFGITYIAWDQKLKRTVAIKEFFPNSLSTRSEGESSVSCYDAKALRFFNDGIKKMLDEGSRLSKFSGNENIVNVYDCFEENNTAYIVMEYLEGKDLKQYLAENGGKLSPEKAVEIILPVLNALEDMHKEKIIHRDIAPDNIFLCGNGKIKLLDFGSARLAVEDSEKSLSVMVKRGYAPKEQYASRSKQGPWTDVYAVCATLYKMITGSLPSESMERDIAPLESFAKFGINGFDELEKVIFKGLEPEISDRIQGVSRLKKCLLGCRNIQKFEPETIEKKIAPNQQPPKQRIQTEVFYGNRKGKRGLEWIKNHQKTIIFVFTSVFIILILLYWIWISRVSFGENIDCHLSLNGTLTIGGVGEIKDCSYEQLDMEPWRKLVKNVVIEEGITEIGNFAFAECTKIESISLPETITRIGEAAFLSCGFEHISLPDSLSCIEARAFAECPNLDTLRIPENVTYIGAGILGGYDACVLDTLYYNAIDCKDVEDRIFQGVDGGVVKNIYIGDEVKTIPDKIFAEIWFELEHISIPDSVTKIGSKAFYDCDSLKSIYISEGVTQIGENAFSNCEYLEEVRYAGSEKQWFAIDFSEGFCGIYLSEISYSKYDDNDREHIADYSWKNAYIATLESLNCPSYCWYELGHIDNDGVPELIVMHSCDDCAIQVYTYHNGNVSLIHTSFYSNCSYIEETGYFYEGLYDVATEVTVYKLVDGKMLLSDTAGYSSSIGEYVYDDFVTYINDRVTTETEYNNFVDRFLNQKGTIEIGNSGKHYSIIKDNYIYITEFSS